MANVRMVHAALDDSPLRGGSIILRGVIDPDSLGNLLVDDYQREVLVGAKQTRLMAAFQSGESIPDIDLGMRGQNYYQPKSDGVIKDDEFVLKDPVYIIDGWQRVSAALQLRATSPIYLGATVHFDTTRDWERERFYILNTSRVKVSPNIHLRNLRETHAGVLALYGLTNNDKTFPGYQRVAWTQAQKRSDLLGAFTFAKVTGFLHSWQGPNLRSAIVPELANAIDRLVNEIGVNTYKNNAKQMIDVIDKCWGFSHIQYRESSPQLKSPFLLVLASLFCDHKDFWTGKDGREFFVSADMRRKLGQFKMQDPAVQNLAGASGQARHVLYSMLRDHINSGRKKNRLRPRDPAAPPSYMEDDDDVAAAA